MGTWGVAFSICYLLGFSLEFTRGWLKLPAPRWGIPVLIAIGLVFHTWLLSSLFPNVWQQRRGVYANWGHWCLVISWFLVTSDLITRWTRPQHVLSIFLLPLSLAFIALAWYLPKGEVFAANRSWQLLGVTHGLLLLSASVFISLGFVSGLMYLWQARRLKRKVEGSRWPQLPSLEWLWLWTERCLVASVTFLISGLGSGFVLNLLSYQSKNPSIPWSDPIIVCSLFLLAWILAVAIFRAAYPPARLGNKVAYLTIASFIFFAVLLGVVFFVPTSHARSKQPRAAVTRAEPRAYGNATVKREERCLSV
jgi:hypothetical protein